FTLPSFQVLGPARSALLPYTTLFRSNTSMALDVAYITPDWTIAQLVQLEPFDQTPVPSPGPVIAALEMPRGWFASHGIKVGAKVDRKSTRLNSSHVKSSYAVFCLEKK